MDTKGHQPWLFKAMWGGYEEYGELLVDSASLNRLIWAGEEDADSLTDLGKTPIKRGTIIRIHETDEIGSDVYDFTVADVREV